MSSETVRAAFRSRIATLLEPQFAWQESVNVARESKTLPHRWYTMDFVVASIDRVALGRPSLMRESGSVRVMIYTEQQIGDAPATAAAFTIFNSLCNWAAGHLRIMESAPPNDMDGGDIRGAWFAQSVDTRYQFDSFVP